MKKILAAGSLILALGVGSAFVYADSGINHRDEFKKQIEVRKQEVSRDLKEGLITENEAKAWEEHLNHMDEMDEYHFENGGHCGGRMGMRSGRGHRRGMGRHSMGL